RGARGARDPRRHRRRGRRPGQRRRPGAVGGRDRAGPRAGPGPRPRGDRADRARGQPSPHRHRPPRRLRSARQPRGDRMSTAAPPLQPGIPDKGRLLTGISLFWFEQLADIVPHHVLSATDVPEAVAGRAVRCRGLDMVELECIARGHLTGSGLADYRAGGSVGGHALPSGLVEASRLEPAIFTPSTKAGPGEHDENITVAQARELLGEELTEQLETLTLAVFERARRIADERGIILADTKLEFGR